MTDELSRPVFPSEPKLGLNPVPVIERSPTGIAMIPQVLLKVAAIIVALAGVGVVVFTALMPAAGATVAPLPWVVTGLAICSGIVAVGTTLGIVSQGVRTKEGTVPVVEATPLPSPRPSVPKFGPPQ
jgi:hypothetical protein